MAEKPKRILAVACSHGHLIDEDSAKAVLKFKRDFNPHRTIHLGDFIDVSAFMGGHIASGEGADVSGDMESGIDFVRQLEPDIIFNGNHEDRLWKLRESSNRELVVYAASRAIDAIEYMARDLKAELVPYAGTFDPNSWRTYGGTAFGHGFMFGEMCARDHAEMLGRPVVFGHAHKIIRQPARTLGAPEGICAGCLCSVPAMAYAKTRRQTAAWDNGWVFGEYTDKWCKLYVERRRAWQPAEIPHGK